MATTKRQQIIDAIGPLLATVVTLRTVGEWRHLPEESRDLPAASYYDKTGAAAPQAGGVTLHTMEVSIDIAAAGTDPRASVRSLAGDILSALSADRRLGGLLTGSRLTGFDMGFESASLKTCLGNLKLEVTYETDNWSL